MTTPFPQQGWRLPAAALLAALCALQLLCVLRAPAAYFPAAIDVRLQPNQALTLGRQELAAPQADVQHLGLRRDAAGRWLVHNESASHQLLLQRHGEDERTGSTNLRSGDRFQLGAAVFKVEAARADTVAFTDGTHHWHYDGALLLRDGQALPPCPDTRLAARLAGFWSRWAPRMAAIPRPLSFGGNLHCANRLGIAGVAPHSAVLASRNGALQLAAAGGPLLLFPSTGPVDLARREISLDGVGALVIGHTRLLATLDGGVLHLRPASHVALFAAPQAQLPEGVAWHWRQRDLWSLPRAAAWLVVLSFVAAVPAGVVAWLVCGRGRTMERARASAAPQHPTLDSARERHTLALHAFATVLLVVAGIGVLLLQRSGNPVPVALSMLLAWGALWHAVIAPKRPELGLAAGTLLLAVGLLAQLELGLGAADSSWTRHFQKSAALLAVGLPAACWLSRRGFGAMQQARAERILLGLAAAALAGLALQVALGDETGVFDLQPVEFAKLALAALTAHCIALGLSADTEASGALLRWLRLFMPALLFVVLLAVGLVQVDDYSPLILLLVWSGAMAFAWALAARKTAALAALVTLGCSAILAVTALHGAGPAQLAQWNFYPERFLVWLDPAAHPHTGQQLLLGARAVAAGGWTGADHAFGLAALGQQSGAVLRIPAVQDDFAPSFFLNRHGLAAALALWTLQALFLVGMLQSAVRAWSASTLLRDFRHAWRARFRCFALCGGAAFVLGHFLLSWGTNLAIFPIMGQPMSFLSAGGSHLLFFICPLLAMVSASATSFEESHHAGLRAT
jgi:cell division protein FtsW